MINRADEATDAELVCRLIAGDEEAFRAVYARCQGPIFRFVLHLSGSQAIAEDVTQEVFMVLLQEGSRFDPARGTLQSYLFGVGRNLALRLIKREQWFLPLADEDPREPKGTSPAGCRSSAVAPADLSRAETIARVRQATLSLPLKYREIVVLCDLQEKSYDEAAALVGCAVGTIRSRLHRARALLVEKLRDHGRPDAKPAAQLSWRGKDQS